MTGHEALALTGVRRTFGATVALDAAHCTVRRGTIHALLGENGAGKTTLMRLAFGLLPMEQGTLRVDGTPVRFRSSAEAIARGLGMVHQHFMLVPALTVAENVALGGRGRLDRRAVAARLRAIGEATGLTVDPDARIADLPVSAQQRVEIVKALARDARVLILDEPTAVLTPDQATELLRWLRRFADGGGTVVLITHKLREAMGYADDITVLRQGRTVLAAPRASLTEAGIIAALTGESGTTPPGVAIGGEGAPPAAEPHVGTAPVLALDGAAVVDEAGVTRLHATTLAVARSEILGVIGVEGSGQRELLRLLAGRLAPTTGRVRHPARVGFVPEDRLHDAVIPALTLTENLALAGAGDARGLLDWPALRTAAASSLHTDDVRAPGPDISMAALSGGNQQKFVLGRERRVGTEALVVENPTRGLDLRASATILETIRTLGRDRAIVFHSSDLDEVLAVATRIVACFDGRVREVPRPADPADRTPYTQALVGAG